MAKANLTSFLPTFFVAKPDAFSMIPAKPLLSMKTLQTARSYEELLGADVAPAPYDYAVLFEADGFFARRRAKKRFKLLRALDPKLQRMLRPGERVYFVTSGATVSLSEQLFVGWIAYYLNLRALVFTTERMLLIQINGRQSAAKELAAQIPYTSIASVKATWNGYCQVSLMDKKKYKFLYVPSADRKFLAKFLGDIVQGTTAPFAVGAQARGLENLCPHCYTVVPGYPDGCQACGGGFKSANKAALLSLLFPGLGDWYLGHRGFALMELLGSGFLWLALVVLPLTAPRDPEVGPLDGAYWTTVAIMLGTAHVIDAVMTRHFARKGHHPHGVPTALVPPIPA